MTKAAQPQATAPNMSDHACAPCRATTRWLSAATASASGKWRRSSLGIGHHVAQANKPPATSSTAAQHHNNHRSSARRGSLVLFKGR